MVTYRLEEDIKVYYITAPSFPDCVLETHQKMHSLVTYNPGRKSFGISYPVKTGKIIYKVAAEELENGELEKHGLEEMIIPKGDYLFIDIKEFTKNVPAISKAFDKLIHDVRIDPNGFCVEWYLDMDTCRCMVKTKHQ
ncbi:MAG: hypothetical protein WBP16_02205 [Ferruginibacter sp.]